MRETWTEERQKREAQRRRAALKRKATLRRRIDKAEAVIRESTKELAQLNLEFWKD